MQNYATYKDPGNTTHSQEKNNKDARNDKDFTVAILIIIN